MVRAERRRGRRHPRRAAEPAPRTDPRTQPRPYRAGLDGADPPPEMDLVLARPDSPRAASVPGAPPQVRGVRRQSPLSQLSRMTALPPVDQATLVATRRDLHQHPELGFQE